MKDQRLKIKEVPVPGQFKHPPAPNTMLPSHEFTLGIIGKSFISF
jgi:hypothetical protein